MFDGRWRGAVDRTTTPVGQALHRRGVTADVLTATGLVTATATAAAIATGHFPLAVVLLVLTGAHDLFDGPVAKAGGTASVRGAFFDSVTDRVTDAVLFGGVAWYLVSAGRGHLVLLPFAILAASALISYERAKAEALGLSAKGGLMERAERMILLGIGLLATWLLVPVLWAMLVLVTATAVGRFAKVWKAAEGPAPRPTTPVRAGRSTGVAGVAGATGATGGAAAAGLDGASGRPAWRPGRVESRWRAWRESSTPRHRAVGRAGEPVGRWRARRQEALASRTGRAMRRRRTRQPGRTVARRSSTASRRP